jgi:uncharacterized OB-fold protein
MEAPMDSWKTGVENMVYPGRIKVPYKWDVGEIGSYFLVKLRDHKELWGRRCPECKKVYVPPVKNCGECFALTDEWVRVKDKGILESFTVVHYAHGMQPSKPPLIYGLVRLEGADGAILHLLGDVNPEELKTGMSLKARFADERKGSIHDIRFFAPA